VQSCWIEGQAHNPHAGTQLERTREKAAP